jgi:hypothetical protein
VWSAPSHEPGGDRRVKSSTAWSASSFGSSRTPCRVNASGVEARSATFCQPSKPKWRMNGSAFSIASAGPGRQTIDRRLRAPEPARSVRGSVPVALDDRVELFDGSPNTCSTRANRPAARCRSSGRTPSSSSCSSPARPASPGRCPRPARGSGRPARSMCAIVSRYGSGGFALEERAVAPLARQ